MLCAQSHYVWERLTPCMQNLYGHHFTSSLRGLPGRHVPLDHHMEKVNRSGKQLMDGVVTADMIQTRIPWLNTLTPLEHNYFVLTDENARNKPQKTCVDLDADVYYIKGLLMDFVGSRKTQLTSTTNQSAFTGRTRSQTVLPRSRVARKAQSWRSWLDLRNADLTFWS